jgi:predicted O-methyltransferase YrrM
VAQGQPLSVSNASLDDLYGHVLAAYADLGYPAEIVNSWAISYNDVPDLLTAVRRVQPKKILEVGTYVGVSTMLLALVCPDAHIVTVDPDLPLEVEMAATGSSIANVDAKATTQAVAKAAAAQLGLADRITFVKGGFAVGETFSSSLTHDGVTVEVVGPDACQEGGPFDFVFIDGLHTAEAVAADISLASEHLSPGGLIALHDCVGFWGANVRAGVLEFLRRKPDHQFVHPPFAAVWRSVGIVAPKGSKHIDRSAFITPIVDTQRSAALGETFSTLAATVFGDRDILEVSVGTPLLPGTQDSLRRDAVRVLGGRTAKNLNAELDRILSSFDQLDNPIVCSADLLDFAPAELVQNLLTAVAYRKGELLLGVTPPGESGVAGPESRPASWLIDVALARGLSAYAPASLDLEPARYALLPTVRELGGNSRLVSFIVIAAKGGRLDVSGKPLLELSPAIAAEREQAELQRVHIAAAYHQRIRQIAEADRMKAEQEAHLQAQIRDATEVAQREKNWREESTQSYTSQVASLEGALTSARTELDAIRKHDQLLSSQMAAMAAHTQLELAMRDGREKNLLRILDDNAEAVRRNDKILQDNEAANRAHVRAAQEAADRYKAELDIARNDHQTRASQLVAERDQAHARAETAEKDLSDMAVTSARMTSELAEVRGLIEDYSTRLIDAYRAIDAFDTMVTLSETSPNSFKNVALTTVYPGWRRSANNETTAEMERLLGKWQAVLAGLNRAAENGGARVRSLLNQSDEVQQCFLNARAGVAEAQNALTRETRVNAPNGEPPHGGLSDWIETLIGKRKKGGASKAGGFHNALQRIFAMRTGRAVVKAKAKLDAELAHLGFECPAFDTDFYHRTYSDVPAGQGLRHYLAFGEREGRQPFQKFDPGFYLAANPDVLEKRQSPLLHFLSHGLREGRSPCASLHPLVDLAKARGMTPLEFFVRS